MKTGFISNREDAIFAPPTIYLDDDRNVRYFAAAVSSHQLRLDDRTIVYTKERLERISLTAAAASVFEKDLLRRG